MANVLNRNTLEFLRSVNTPDYDPEDWIINPDLSNVEGVLPKYWKLVDNEVVEMTEAEKEAVDDALREAHLSNRLVSEGDTFELSFADDRNNIQNRWLGLTGNNNIFSNDTPAIIGWKAKLVSINWSNQKNDVDFDIQIHSGIGDGTSSVLRYSTNITSKIAYIQNIQNNIVFEAGEQLAVFIKRTTNKRPSKAVLKLGFKILDASVENFNTDDNVRFSPA